MLEAHAACNWGWRMGWSVVRPHVDTDGNSLSVPRSTLIAACLTRRAV